MKALKTKKIRVVTILFFNYYNNLVIIKSFLSKFLKKSKKTIIEINF